MKFIFLSLMTHLLSANVSAHFAGNFYNTHEEGWFWYKDPKFDTTKEQDTMKKEAPADKPKTTGEAALKNLENYKKSLEEAKAIALMNPTVGTVRQYLYKQKDMMERADTFSNVFQNVVLTHPDLNPEVQNPTAQFARSAVYSKNAAHKDAVLKTVAAQFGLFFFTSPHCKFCESFAPVVKQLSHIYGFTVFVIVMNGDASSVPELAAQFTNIQSDNGMAAAFNIEATPALMAYNQDTNDVIPVSYAAVSMVQLEDQILFLKEKQS